MCIKKTDRTEPVQQQKKKKKKRPPRLSAIRLELLGSVFCNPTDTLAKASTNQARSPPLLMPSTLLTSLPSLSAFTNLPHEAVNAG